MNKFLSDYFKNQANIVDCKYRASGITIKQPTDIGENREYILLEFLNDHLPYRSKASRGGKIIDKDNAEGSNQIDLIIYADNVPTFRSLEKTLYMVEGVYVAIEVKTELTRQDIQGTEKKKSIIENCLSVKNLTKNWGAGSLRVDSGEPSPKVLYGVFAYESSLSPTDLIREINNKYQNKSITDSRFKIDFICINKKLFVVLNKGAWKKKTLQGEEDFPQNQYILVKEGELSLFEMFLLVLREIGQAIYTVPDYNKYILS